MMESIFSKIYTYRERENKNSKENFLIEIFGHCLLTDNKLSESFLQLLDLEFEKNLSVKTQSIYDGYGRPDLELNLPKSGTCILIECKVEHFERQNQLEDYKQILIEKDVKHRHLVYLTKYYEYRENEHESIKFSLIRWSDIYAIIDEENNEITQELKSFLKEENMAESKNFHYNDITTLLTITDTLSKMDEVIDSIKDYFEKNIGGLSKDSSRSTRMSDSWYVAFHAVGKPNLKFTVDLGFMWWDEDVSVGVRIWIPRAAKYTETENYKKLFAKELKDWTLDEFDNSYTFTRSKLVTEFIISEEEQIPQMREFLKEQIDLLVKLKKTNSNIFS